MDGQLFLLGTWTSGGGGSGPNYSQIRAELDAAVAPYVLATPVITADPREDPTMANISAAANGNWSAGATWTGGVKPGPGDVAGLNGKTITLDEDPVCAEITDSGLGTGGLAWAAGVRDIKANLKMTITRATAFCTITGTGGVTQAAQFTNTSTYATSNGQFISYAGSGGVTMYSAWDMAGGTAVTATGVATGALRMAGTGNFATPALLINNGERYCEPGGQRHLHDGVLWCACSTGNKQRQLLRA